MDIRKYFYTASLILITLMGTSSLRAAEDQKKSPVYKEQYKFGGLPFILYSAFDAQLIETFVLMQDANAGKPVAQHELGIRYLIGRGLPPDTAKAVYWLMKAAEHNLPLAHFNLGILHLHGIGVPWNPFEAFKHFRAAAQEEIPEALFATGILYSENFIVPHNWPKTFNYIKRAAELGAEDAAIALKELRDRGIDSVEIPDKVISKTKKQKRVQQQTASNNPTSGLIFIDFHTDTTTKVNDTTLIREAYRELNIPTQESLAREQHNLAIDSVRRSTLLAAADIGNPEALNILGRCYEKGWGVKKDLILAGAFYFRAVRMESYRAPGLLWHLMNTEEFEHNLQNRTTKNDPIALYVWAGITALDFSKLLNEQQAFQVLQRAADAGYVPAMVELGLCYFNGRWTEHSTTKAMEWWTKASTNGSTDADFRIAMMNILKEARTESLDSALSFIHSIAEKGSLLADVAIGYCYEKGFQVPQNKGEAYRIYEQALHRGSETAYNSLRRMHDELRPTDPEFQIESY